MSSHEHDAWFSHEIEKLGPTLFRVAFAILRNRTDCEDAAQNAVLKAYRSLGALKQRRYFKTWLIQILKNECLSFLCLVMDALYQTDRFFQCSNDYS